MASSEPNWRRIDLLIILGLFIVTGGLFARTTQFPFLILDDRDYVVNNAHVQAGLSYQSIRWAFTTYYVANWHPLTWLSLQLDRDLYGDDAFYFHVTNILLHACNSALLFMVLRCFTLQRWPSAFAAALFAWHPLHVESVAWVAERKDVLSTFFWLLTMAAYWRYVQKPGLWRYALVALLLALGLMAKPMVVTLPLVLLLLDYWPLRRFVSQSALPATQGPAPLARALQQFTSYRLFLEKVPLLLLVAGSCYLTMVAQTEGGAVRSLAVVPMSERIANVALAYVGYLAHTFWPLHLAIFYPLTHPAWTDPSVLFAFGLLAAITVAVILLRCRFPYLAVGWFWYVGTLIPVIGLVQVGLQSMADRYTYVPLIGIFMMIAWAASDIVQRLQVARGLLAAWAAILLVALLGLTWRQLGFWKDNLTLWEHTLEVSGPSFTTYLNLGFARLETNDRAGALADFDRALEFKPDDEPSLFQRGTILLSLGAEEQAFQAFAAAVKAHPESHRAQGALALRYTSRNQPEQSIPHYLKAIASAPKDLRSYVNVGWEYMKLQKFADAKHYFLKAAQLGQDARINLGLAAIALRQGEYAEAVRQSQEAVRLEPKNALALQLLSVALFRNEQYRDAVAPAVDNVILNPNVLSYRCYLGMIFARAGEKVRAKEQYDIATRMNGNWPQIWVDRARTLATDDDPERRDGAEALELAVQACQASPQPNPDFFAVLAMAYAEVGKTSEAAQVANEAIKLAQSPEHKNLADALQEQLRSYTNGQPIRRPKSAGPNEKPQAKGG